jgi:hypothetical protein
VDDPACIGFANGENQFSWTEWKRNCSARNAKAPVLKKRMTALLRGRRRSFRGGGCALISDNGPDLGSKAFLLRGTPVATLHDTAFPHYLGSS